MRKIAAILFLVAALFVCGPQRETTAQINNPVSLPINLATQVTGTLPGANYAQVNLAGTGNGGVGGVLPAANEGTGTPSASNFLRGDGAWSAAVSEGVINWGDIGGGSTGACANVTVTAFAGCGADWFWANAHTLTRFKVVQAADAGCTVQATIAIRDITSATNLTSFTTVAAGQTFDSGVISIATTAGHDFVAGFTNAATTCTTNPSISTIKITYQ